jgi:hypothetical protein
VLALVADGLANRAIAARMFVTERIGCAVRRRSLRSVRPPSPEA